MSHVTVGTPFEYGMSTPAPTSVIYTYQKYSCVLNCPYEVCVKQTLCYIHNEDDDTAICLVHTYTCSHLTKCSLYSHTSNTPTGRSSSLLGNCQESKPGHLWLESPVLYQLSNDNHQPSQSSICTAQVVLNASVTHLAATQ